MNEPEKLWDKVISAKTQQRREYWIDRYEKAQSKKYKPKLSKINPIDKILRGGNK